MGKKEHRKNEKAKKKEHILNLLVSSPLALHCRRLIEGRGGPPGQSELLSDIDRFLR
jgi:hypothetical protein